MCAQYISYAKLKQQFGISMQTAKNWEEQGKLVTIRTPGGKRLYSQASLNAAFGIVDTPTKEKKSILYARVSSKQKEDLQRQCAYLQERFPHHELLADTGSGLNWKRPGFKRLLEAIDDGSCGQVVVTYRDRLCRFGFELVEWLASKRGCSILVCHQDESVQGSVELADDLLAVVTFFTARHHGKRSGQHKKAQTPGQEGQRKRRKGVKDRKEESEEEEGFAEEYC